MPAVQCFISFHCGVEFPLTADARRSLLEVGELRGLEQIHPRARSCNSHSHISAVHTYSICHQLLTVFVGIRLFCSFFNVVITF